MNKQTETTPPPDIPAKPVFRKKQRALRIVLSVLIMIASLAACLWEHFSSSEKKANNYQARAKLLVSYRPLTTRTLTKINPADRTAQPLKFTPITEADFDALIDTMKSDAVVSRARKLLTHDQRAALLKSARADPTRSADVAIEELLRQGTLVSREKGRHTVLVSFSHADEETAINTAQIFATAIVEHNSEIEKKENSTTLNKAKEIFTKTMKELDDLRTKKEEIEKKEKEKNDAEHARNAHFLTLEKNRDDLAGNLEKLTKKRNNLLRLKNEKNTADYPSLTSDSLHVRLILEVLEKKETERAEVLKKNPENTKENRRLTAEITQAKIELEKLLDVFIPETDALIKQTEAQLEFVKKEIASAPTAAPASLEKHGELETALKEKEIELQNCEKQLASANTILLYSMASPPIKILIPASNNVSYTKKIQRDLLSMVLVSGVATGLLLIVLMNVLWPRTKEKMNMP
ncbi:MAG: hypothetical protein LBS59_08020 [Puniceicoccales bacterium]|jgi:hypothetical protein|nr:hypothetical protein [Puniceicoccales bacterium]